jgi:hypothetical protein
MPGELAFTRPIHGDNLHDAFLAEITAAATRLTDAKTQLARKDSPAHRAALDQARHELDALLDMFGDVQRREQERT